MFVCAAVTHSLLPQRCQRQTCLSKHSTRKSGVVLTRGETHLSTLRDGKAFSCQKKPRGERTRGEARLTLSASRCTSNCSVRGSVEGGHLRVSISAYINIFPSCPLLRSHSFSFFSPVLLHPTFLTLLLTRVYCSLH